MSLLNMQAPRNCPECGTTAFDFEWLVHKHRTANCSVVDGRLAMHDIAVDFVLGCQECSATIMTKTADEVAKSLTEDGF